MGLQSRVAIRHSVRTKDLVKLRLKSVAETQLHIVLAKQRIKLLHLSVVARCLIN
jgi:hypothetical protein